MAKGEGLSKKLSRRETVEKKMEEAKTEWLSAVREADEAAAIMYQAQMKARKTAERLEKAKRAWDKALKEWEDAIKNGEA